MPALCIVVIIAEGIKGWWVVAKAMRAKQEYRGQSCLPTFLKGGINYVRTILQRLYSCEKTGGALFGLDVPESTENKQCYRQRVF